MKILHSIKSLEPVLHSTCMTIGNFDGLHLGHRLIFDRLKSIAKKLNGKSLIVTFENHPKSIVNPENQLEAICSLPHKLNLFHQLEIDYLLLLPFTEKLKEMSAEDFIGKLHHSIPFTHLTLGYDAKLGKDRDGTKDLMHELSNKFHFQLEYLDPLLIDNEPVSSTKIRSYIKSGNFSKFEELIGRKYSIYNEVVKGESKGKLLGFPTANLNVSGLCLPPFGVYAVLAKYKNKVIPAVANLGYAPTIRDHQTPILEIHLFNQNIDLYGQIIDITFYEYLRPEKKFLSIEDLKLQIQQDIDQSKNLFKNHDLFINENDFLHLA